MKKDRGKEGIINGMKILRTRTIGFGLGVQRELLSKIC
jgi:hypothetical protein